jgi:hypothetical protein
MTTAIVSAVVLLLYIGLWVAVVLRRPGLMGLPLHG